MKAQDSTLFEQRGRKSYFRGLPVKRHEVRLNHRLFRIDALADAADILDEADYARRFIDQDIAPYGLELWPSAAMLCEHLLDACPHPRPSVIELGCGLGLVSIVLAAHGWNIRATDYESTTIEFARHNARLNGIENVSFSALDWREPPGGESYDMILASDVLYQLVDHTPFLACLRALLRPGGVVYVADPNRGVAGRFAPAALTAGFEYQTTERSTDALPGKTAHGRIFRLQAKPLALLARDAASPPEIVCLANQGHAPIGR